MNSVTGVEARWLLPCGDDREWVLARDLLGAEDQLVDAYLTRTRLSCCAIQMGFFIDVDGNRWSDDGTVDEPWMTMTLLEALGDLLASDVAAATACPWEESSMRLERRGERLVMVDVHHSGNVSLPRVEVPFRAFLAEMHREGEVLVAVARGLRRELVRRRAEGADERALRHFEVIEENVASERHIEELASLVERLRPPAPDAE